MLGGMSATEDSLRAAVCQAAADALASWPADHAEQVAAVRAIWDSVIQRDPSGMYTKAWCGAFALSCLRAAGLADSVWWVPGVGFLERCCTHTSAPKPGDVAYFAQPFQHHALVTAVDAERGTFDSIDGNQPGIMQHLARPLHVAAFYSIAPMIERALKVEEQADV